MIPVIVIRPRPGCGATVAAARAQGLDGHGFPLFTVAPRTWQAPALADFDALLLGSANALAHAGPALARYAGKPAYAVGGPTARAAAAAGLDVVAVGERGLQAVLARVRPGDRRLLRLAGATRVTLVAPAGVTIAERIVYASEPLRMPPQLAALLAAPALVLLHSAAAARHLARECDRHGLARAGIALAALGLDVAAAAGDGWRAVAAASEPRDSALLALAARMCQDARTRGQDVHET